MKAKRGIQTSPFFFAFVYGSLALLSFYPAPGYRDGGYYKGYGVLRAVGSSGFSWSAAEAGSNASYLSFDVNGVYPQGSYGRANGFQLRCLQEHPKGVLLGLFLPNFLPRQARLECPAAPPGFRDAFGDRGYGGLRDVGVGGFSWSSTASGTSARYLSFTYSWLNPQNSSNRAHGLPLRCLQEKGTTGHSNRTRWVFYWPFG